MDHPNIAHVLDAGATESGRPYFVMDLVHGVPITEYCDRNQLTMRDRLELFVQVCRAVQHAHQKGIIHRDIKPSNVMVTLHDHLAVPKIIDFGVAKATHQQLTEKTLFTRYGQMVGTPLYMSPEQSQMNGLHVDTRSDIYASDIMLAAQAWREGDLRRLANLLDEQRPQPGEPDLRGFEWYYLWQLPRVSHFQLEGHRGAVYSTCCSPDGRLIATAGEEAVVRIYDVDTRQVRTKIETGHGEVNGVAFAPDGHTLASAGDDGTVRVWDLDTEQQVRRIDAHPGEAYLSRIRQ